jgi:hypothetical protein
LITAHCINVHARIPLDAGANAVSPDMLAQSRCDGEDPPWATALLIVAGDLVAAFLDPESEKDGRGKTQRKSLGLASSDCVKLGRSFGPVLTLRCVACSRGCREHRRLQGATPWDCGDQVHRPDEGNFRLEEKVCHGGIGGTTWLLKPSR